ncbi:MAG: hypothetical protein AAFP76_08555 [Bacteroidota bacterium]
MKKIGIIIVVLGIILVSGLYITSRMASNEVLEAFGTMNEKIIDANEATLKRNDSLMKTLTQSNIGDQQEQAKLLDSISNRLNGYLEGVKEGMMKSISDPSDYEIMDQSTYLDELFFDGDAISEKGQEFIDEMNGFRNSFILHFNTDYPEITQEVATTFTTADVQDRNGNKVHWLRYHYQGFPLIASKTRMTQIQADIRMAKQQVLNAMLMGKE